MVSQKEEMVIEGDFHKREGAHGRSSSNQYSVMVDREAIRRNTKQLEQRVMERRGLLGQKPAVPFGHLSRGEYPSEAVGIYHAGSQKCPEDTGRYKFPEHPNKFKY